MIWTKIQRPSCTAVLGTLSCSPCSIHCGFLPVSVPRKCHASKSFLTSGTLHTPYLPPVTSSSFPYVVSFQSSGLIAQRGFCNLHLTRFPLHPCLHLTVGSLRAEICLTILSPPACSSLSGAWSKLSMSFPPHCLAVSFQGGCSFCLRLSRSFSGFSSQEHRTLGPEEICLYQGIMEMDKLQNIYSLPTF